MATSGSRAARTARSSTASAGLVGFRTYAGTLSRPDEGYRPAVGQPTLLSSLSDRIEEKLESGDEGPEFCDAATATADATADIMETFRRKLAGLRSVPRRDRAAAFRAANEEMQAGLADVLARGLRIRTAFRQQRLRMKRTLG